MANTYRKTGKAPSGRSYVYRGLNPFEAMEVYGGFIELNEVKPEGDLKASEIAEIREVCMRIVTLGTISPRVVDAEDPKQPDAVPFDELGSDMMWLQAVILQETGLSGVKADEARRFRGQRRKLRSASRNGEGSGSEAERGDDATGEAGASPRVRSHSVDQGSRVASRGDGEGTRAARARHG